MAKGFGFANKERSERKARQGGSSAFTGKQIFKLPEDGDTGEVRFVPDDDGDIIYGCYVHEVAVEGRAYPDLVPCIAQDEDGNDTDDPCPGCERDLKRKARFFVQVLWKDAPVYKKDGNGKAVKDSQGDLVVIDHEDQLAVWPMGPQLEELLEEIDEEWGDADSPGEGLTIGVFKVRRKGEKLDTTYKIKPLDPRSPEMELDDDEQELMDSDSYIDLNEFTKAPSYEEFEARISGKAFGKKEKESSNGKSSKASRAAKSKNPFGGSRKSKGGKKRRRREEDDEE